MCEYAEAYFKLHKVDQSGVSQYEHLEQVERQTGRKPSGLELPDFPLPMADNWTAFSLLHQGRTTGFSGPNPITYEQIKAWRDLTETPLSGRDIEVIKRIDQIYMKVMNG